MNTKEDVKMEANEDPDFSKKKFKPEDIEKFETYDDSMPKSPKKSGAGLFGLGAEKKAGSAGKTENKGLFGLGKKALPKDAGQDYQEYPMKEKKNKIFTPKTSPFDDSIDTYDHAESAEDKKFQKKAALIAIVVLVGIIGILLLFKSVGIIGAAVKSDLSTGVSADNATGKVATASKKTGFFGFGSNEAKQIDGKIVSTKCLADMGDAETLVAEKEAQIDALNEGVDKTYTEMTSLISYYQKQIDEKKSELDTAEADLAKTKEKLSSVKDQCLAK